jgi:hypothetical protein
MVALKDFGVGKKSVEERIHEEVQFLSELFSKQQNKPTDVSKVLDYGHLCQRGENVSFNNNYII